MTSQSLEERLERLGEHLDLERSHRQEGYEGSSGSVATQSESRNRTRKSIAALAAVVALVLGGTTYWPTGESTVTTVSQSTVPSSDERTTPFTTPSSEPPVEVDRSPTVAGVECFQRFESHIARWPEEASANVPWERVDEFSEALIPTRLGTDGFIILFAPMKLIVCRDSADGVSFATLDLPESLGDDESDVSFVSVGYGTKSGPDGYEEDLRIIGRSSADIETLKVQLEDGKSFGAVVHEGWFVVDSGPFETADRNLADQMDAGTAIVEWSYTDGRSESATIEALDVNATPKVEPTTYPAGFIESLPIFTRDETEADLQQPIWLAPAEDLPGLSAEHDLATARRGAELDGFTVWVMQSSPRGRICVYEASSQSFGGGCQSPVEDGPLDAICFVSSDSINGTYLFGLILSDKAKVPDGAAAVDGTYILQLSDGEVDFAEPGSVLEDLGCAFGS